MAAISDVIKARFIDHQKALEAGDLEAASRTFCQNAVGLAPDKKPCVGRAAIRDFISELAEGGKVTLEYRDVDSVQVELLAGDFATVMPCFYIVIDGNKTGPFKALEIWKKEDGQWYMYRTAYNPCPE